MYNTNGDSFDSLKSCYNFGIINTRFMNTIEKTDYQLPEVTVIDIAYEGVVCSSNEILDENYGEW